MGQKADLLPREPGHDPEFDIVGRGMEQWRRERPDIDCSGKAIVGRVLRLHDVILRAVNEVLAPHGLRYPSYAVLATLRASGEPFQMSPSRLKQTLLLSSGGISNLLARLERSGWIRRRADRFDGRGVVVELTGEGRTLIDGVMPYHAEVERSLVAMFEAEEQNELAALLSRMLIYNGSPMVATGLPTARPIAKPQESPKPKVQSND